MTRFKFQLFWVPGFLFVLLVLLGSPATSSNPTSDRGGVAPIIGTDYRSATAAHKVIVYEHESWIKDQIIAEGGTLIEDYGSFALLTAPAELADAITTGSQSGVAVRDDLNLVLLRTGVLDTTDEAIVAAGAASELHDGSEGLYLVHLVGPPKDEWVSALESAGRIVSYIPNNAYLLRAEPGSKDRIRELREHNRFIQWVAPFKPEYKIAPEISGVATDEVVVTVQLVTTADTSRLIEAISRMTRDGLLAEPMTALNFTNLRLRISKDKLSEIARFGEVAWIEPWKTPELLDERQSLIISSNLIGNQLLGPGYIEWLRSAGLASTPEFIVDIADSGIDRGELDPELIHEDFLNSAGLSRVAYARLVAKPEIDGSANDTTGHGTMNAGIVGGFNVKQNAPYVDPDGYSLGLGVHPFVKLGVTKIFNPAFTTPDLVAMVDEMYSDGARVSSNSWGSNQNFYTVDSQIYDALVRDASRSVKGNQELTVVFAAGNRGPGGNISMPGTAKNVITVGASENLRDGIDGCNISSDGGDDVHSIISFSSGGPVADGRVKPDIVAPGTHIQAARSQDPEYNGSAICGPKDYPPGQTLYTWSSGTSHSAPAVAGAAALVRQFFQNSVARSPSPAMIKAFLTNSATYMTGHLAGGNLPSHRQGWGLLDLGRAFDNTPQVLIDQNHVLSRTGDVFTMRGRVVDSEKPLRVTLAWTDAPGSPSANPTVNDLDLRVEIDGKTYLGNRLAGESSTEGGPADRLNNVESVRLPAGFSGEFVITVVGANIAGDGVPGNADSTDQDFALVAYNTHPVSTGTGTSLDSPPSVSLTFPAGGERLMVGSTIRVRWDASDDKEIRTQRVEFSSDGGFRYSTIAVLDGRPRHFDWRIPSVPTFQGRVRITALDGFNLPVSSVTPIDFEVEAGPPDTTPPTVRVVTPSGQSIIGGGVTTLITWHEFDNVGVLHRKIEFSADDGSTFEPIALLTAPGSGEEQTFEWPVPASLSTKKGKIRITVIDGEGNSATEISSGRFEIWPMPIINGAEYEVLPDGKKGRLMLSGRNFRIDQTAMFIDDRKMKKIEYDRCEGGICRRIITQDKKLHKRIRPGDKVSLHVTVDRTVQVSPLFQFKRKRN